MKLCLLLLLFCLCHLGLTEDPSPGAPDVFDPVDEDEETEDALHSCRAFSSEEHQAIGGTIERLGLQLLENLPIGPQQPNVILSPLSLAFALAQLTLGARNETEKLLLKSLHAHSLPCYHHILGSLVPHFRNTSLDVATRMYLRPGFEVKLSFVEDSLARYQSRPVPLVSVEEVNQWVENVTNGHIPNFLESIPHDVVLMLMNAVYFKGEWQTRFDPQATSKGAFYLDSQNSVSVDMMKSAQYPLRLLDDPELEAQTKTEERQITLEVLLVQLGRDLVHRFGSELAHAQRFPHPNFRSHLGILKESEEDVASFPFKGNTSFLIVLPLPGRANVSSMLPKLNISDLYRRLPQEKTMQVNLPKVKLQYRQELQEALTKMGLGSLFSGPDLSGISDQPLRVSSVRHASTVELSEEGVEASATTVVTSMRSVSLFSVNSPFLFALIDDTSLTPLFMGIVTNPAPDNNPMLNDDPHGNSTMGDQPVTDSPGERDTDKHSDRLCSKTESVEDSGLQTCSNPAGEEEQLQSVNGLETKTQGKEISKPDDSVPA